jgi:hypothetical protein
MERSWLRREKTPDVAIASKEPDGLPTFVGRHRIHDSSAISFRAGSQIWPIEIAI